MNRLAAAAAIVAFAAGAAHAEMHWRVRAREHYERGKINAADRQGDIGHDGFISAFDLFREDPMRLSYGLAFQRGHLGRHGMTQSFTLTSVGLEVKHFPFEKKPFFYRGGLLANALAPTTSGGSGTGGEFWTYGLAAGVGVELPIWRLGFAPEIGGRFARGTAGKRINDLYIALGVHFYVFKGDAASRKENR